MATRTKSGQTLSDPLFVRALLAALVLLLYWPAFGFNSIDCDDGDYFTRNPHVQSGLNGSGVLWAFRTGTASNWHPLTWLSLMFDASFFTSLSPGGPHISNVIYHAVNCVLLFLLLRKLTGTHWRSALVAALFAIHPLNVESVAWISERKNVLSTLFWLLTLLAYARYVQERDPAHSTSHLQKKRPGFFYGLALVSFACGLMSKPMLVTLPCVLLLLDHWPLNRWRMDSLPDWRRRLPGLLWEKIPFLLLTALSCVVTILVQQHGNAVQSFAHYPLGGRIENAFVSYCRYLGKTVWPENLAVYYPHPGHWPVAVFLPATLFVLTASLAAWHWGRRWPYLMTGWFWFLGTLVPVIGLVQVGGQSMADRYAYVPLIGIFIIISWGAADFFIRRNVPAVLAAATAGCVLGSSTIAAHYQLSFWQNSGTLFQHAVAVTHNNSFANYNLGYYLDQRGENQRAMEYYRAAIQIDPNDVKAHMNLGLVLERLERYNEALRELTEAAGLAPNDVGIHFDMGCVFVELGRRDKAIEQFNEALRLKPDLQVAELRLQELGVTASRTGSSSTTR